MKLLKFLRSLLIILLIAGVVYVIVNPTIKNRAVTYLHVFGIHTPDVKGISTQKAGNITNQLKSDVNNQVDQAKQQAMNVKVSDMLGYLNRVQKIGSDLKSLQDYVKNQISSFSIGKKK